MLTVRNYLKKAQAVALIIHTHKVPYELTVNYLHYYSLIKFHKLVTLNLMTLVVLFLNITLPHAANHTNT